MMKNDHVLHALLDLTHCFHSYWKLLKLCVSKEQGPKSKKKKRKEKLIIACQILYETVEEEIMKTK